MLIVVVESVRNAYEGSREKFNKMVSEICSERAER